MTSLALPWLLVALLCLTPATGFTQASLDFIHLRGGQLVVGAQARPLMLRGVNLSFDRIVLPDGRWIVGTCGELDQNPQSTPVTNWYSERHLRDLARIGFNVVRMNLHYRIFEDDGNPGVYKASAWRFLDTYVGWARNQNIYLILDLHVPPGGIQAGGTGTCLWDEIGRQDRVVNLWRAIAQRYADEPRIAAYDLLNEPSPTGTSLQEGVGKLQALATRITDAIRAVDANHLLIVERVNWLVNADASSPLADWNLDVLHAFQVTVDDDRTIYDSHSYDPSEYALQNENAFPDDGSYPEPGTLQTARDGTVMPRDRSYLDHQLELESSGRQPLFVGEWSPNPSTFGDAKGGYAYIRDMLDIMGQRGIHWTYYAIWNLFTIECCVETVVCCQDENQTTTAYPELVSLFTEHLASLAPQAGQAVLAASPTALEFGPVQVGQTVAGTVTLNNQGSGPLVVSAVVSGDRQVAAAVDSFVIPAQESGQLRLRLRPDPGAARQGLVTLTTNDPEAGQVELTWAANDVSSPFLEVTRTNPPDLSAEVPLEATLEVTFSQPLRRWGGLTSLRALLVPEAAYGPLGGGQLRDDGRTVAFPVALRTGQTYRLVVAAATGRDGASLYEPVATTFATGEQVPMVAPVSGAVRGAADEVPLSGRVVLVDLADRVAGQSAIALDGSFVLEDVPAGRYRLFADVRHGDGRPGAGAYDADGDGRADTLQTQGLPVAELQVVAVPLGRGEPAPTGTTVDVDLDPESGDQALTVLPEVGADRPFGLEVHVGPTHSLVGFAVTVALDTAKVLVEAVDPEGSLLDGGDGVPLYAWSVDPAAGTLEFSGAILAPTPGTSVSGPGLLGRLRLRTTAAFEGESDLTVTRVVLSRTDTEDEVVSAGLTATVSSPAASNLVGDFTGDGVVDLADFFVFADAFGNADPAFDLSGDGALDLADFFIFADSFGP